MSNVHAVPTVRVADGDGYVVINAVEFDQDEHMLFDEGDRHLVPERPVRVVAAESASLADLQKLLGEALDRAIEAESERDEMKARAEAAEARLAKGDKRKAKGNGEESE